MNPEDTATAGDVGIVLTERRSGGGLEDSADNAVSVNSSITGLGI